MVNAILRNIEIPYQVDLCFSAVGMFIYKEN